MRAILSAFLSFWLAITSFFGIPGNGTPSQDLPDSLFDGNRIVSVIVELEGASLLDGVNGAEERKALVASIDSNAAYQKIVDAQQKLRTRISETFSDADLSDSYGYCFIANAITCDVPYRLVDKLEELPGVKSVTVSQTYQAPKTVIPGLQFVDEASHPNDYTGICDARAAGYTGKGMVIAVLDTGFEVEHEAFSSPVENPAFSKASVSLKSAFGFLNTIVPRFSAHYYSEKIPYCYDYAKKDCNVRNESESHGTHVAGIAAGKSKSFTGMAPDAQLLLMKIFDDGYEVSSKGIDMLAALDDCIKLNADVVNLSLGTQAGEEPEDPFEALVVHRLRRAGVCVVASAGNESGFGDYDNVYGRAMHPDLFDYGSVGSPSSFSHYLSVASADTNAGGYAYDDYGPFFAPSVSEGDVSKVRMSSFSSYGPTEDLRLKPEITTPGSSILSSVNSDSYDRMDGTSMAAPCYTGAVAVVKQALKDRGVKLGKRDVSEYIHALLMSTATLLQNDVGDLYSPRRQGAGFLNLTAALSTPAYLTQPDGVSRPKIELGENTSGVLELSFQLHNTSGSSVQYQLEPVVLTDKSGEVDGALANLCEPETQPDSAYSVSYLEGVDADGIVRARAGEDKTVRLRIALSDTLLNACRSVYKNGFFVDGFVVLNGVDESVPTLSVPYMAFFGDWSKPMLLDGTFYDETPSYLGGYWGLSVTDGDIYYPLGYNLFEYSYKQEKVDTKYCAFSTRALGMEKPYVTVSLGFLQNAKFLDCSLFTDGGLFLCCGSTVPYYCRKTVGYNTETHGVLWGGKSGLINGHSYVYKIATRAENYRSGKVEREFPFVVDNDAPMVEYADYWRNEDGDLMLRLRVRDKHYVMGFEVLDAEDYWTCDMSFKDIEKVGDCYDVTLNLTQKAGYALDEEDAQFLKIHLIDYAYNENIVGVYLESDKVQEHVTVSREKLKAPLAFVFNERAVGLDNTPVQNAPQKSGLAAWFEQLKDKISKGGFLC